MPVGAGAALLGGVADGDGGMLVPAVGVGTGGSVSGGSGDNDRTGRPPGADEVAGRAPGALAEADGGTGVARDGRDP